MQGLLEEAKRTSQQLAHLNDQLRQLHGPYLPELPSLLTRSEEYARTVLQLGPQLCLAAGEREMRPEVRLSLSMALQGKSGINDGWEQMQRVAEEILRLSESKSALLEQLEERVVSQAPNLVQLLSANIATRLLMEAGSVAALARLPASTIQVLGKHSGDQAGKALLPHQKHGGWLLEHELLVDLPVEHLRSGLRLLAAKTALAARLDMTAAPTKNMGLVYRQEIGEKLGKRTEPLSLRPKPPIPPPPLQTSKKRGGKRARRLRELYRPTEARKLQNRLAMSVERGESEIMVGDTIKGLGMLSEVGRLNIDDRLRSTLKKQATSKHGKGLGISTSSAAAGHVSQFKSGTATSVAFTPVQGIEVNVAAAKPMTPAESTLIGSFKRPHPK